MATYTQLTLEQAQEVGRAFRARRDRGDRRPGGIGQLELSAHARRQAPRFRPRLRGAGPGGAEGEARLLDHFARHGVSTPRPLPREGRQRFHLRAAGTRVGGSRRRARGGAVSVADGEILCQARVTPDVARTVGEKLAEVHRAGATFPETRPGRFRIADLRVRL